MLRSASILILALSLSGCGLTLAPVPATAPCLPPMSRHIDDTLYFGRAIPAGGEVTDAQFASFLERVVTPRFPDGLTVWDARGQWRDAAGHVIREPSHVLQLFHADSAEAERRIREIVAAYKSEFKQESVLRVRGAACVGF